MSEVITKIVSKNSSKEKKAVSKDKIITGCMILAVFWFGTYYLQGY